MAKRPRKRPRRTFLEIVSSTKARNFAVLVLPLAYALGYFIWSFYSVTARLGFLPVGHPQYLMAGLTFGAMAFLTIAAVRRASKLLLGRKKTGPIHVGVHLGSLAILGGVVIYVFLGILRILQVLVITTTQTIAMALVPLFVVIVVLATQLFFWAISTATNWISAVLTHAGQWVLRRERKTISPDETSLASAVESAVHVSYICVAIAVLLASAVVLLPAMQPEFGGAKVRHAQFDVKTSNLSQEMRKQFFEKPPQSEVARTVNLTVFYAGSEFLLVKVPPNDSTHGVNFELERSTITAIQWQN